MSNPGSNQPGSRQEFSASSNVTVFATDPRTAPSSTRHCPVQPLQLLHGHELCARFEELSGRGEFGDPLTTGHNRPGPVNFPLPKKI